MRKVLRTAPVGGAWAAPRVRPPTLDFHSGHDLTTVEIQSHLGLQQNVEPAWDSLSLSLSAPPPLMLAHSLNE